jgi:hypothetical protein
MNDEIKPFRVIRADELGIKGTVIETMIRESRCIICGDWADREIWVYTKSNEGETHNQVKTKNFSCSEECAMMIALRS